MKKLTIPGALRVGLLMLTSGLTQAAAVSGQGTWETTLQGRDLDGNLATAEAYYDTALGITWLGDAYAGVGSVYDTLLPGSGRMNWFDANAWAAGLDPYGSGITGWRLPNVLPLNGISYSSNFLGPYNGSTEYGFNISAPGSPYPGSTSSEMAHLFYNTLGNNGWFDIAGTATGCPWASCLTNAGPFNNVQSSHHHRYWSATEYALMTDSAWRFSMSYGEQSPGFKDYFYYAWAVHDGDVGAATVPVPAAVWLFGSGLLGLGAVARKRRR